MAKSGAETTINFWSSIFAGIIDFPRFGRKTEPTINDWVLSVLIPKRQKSIIDLLRGKLLFFNCSLSSAVPPSWDSIAGLRPAASAAKRGGINSSHGGAHSGGAQSW